MSSDQNLFSRPLFSTEEAEPFLRNFKASFVESNFPNGSYSSIMFCEKCHRYVEVRSKEMNGEIQYYCPFCRNVVWNLRSNKNGST